ncbi:MAG: hypothetical protein NTU62_06930 [Spirochaetes bacterium]|nr:hypothetical protein [Spirochaetota bacterium]
MKKLVIAAIVLAAAAAGLAAAEKTLAVSFGPVQELLQAKCAGCHDWAGSADGILGKVKPGAPEESLIWQKVSRGLMPPDGPLADAEKTLLQNWIAAGAPTDGAAAVDATTGATEAAGAATGDQAPSTFLGFKSKVAFHMATGYTSSALFLGAGIVGAVQWGTLMQASHEYRDLHGIDEGEISTQCADYISALRADSLHSALRWTHVGLLSAGEALYLADAITGISMLSKDRPGLTPQDIHRYAFFTHGALMISELVLGIASSTFLDLGDHWSIVGVGIAHTAIGVAIPVVMLGAGIYINSVFR